MKPTSLFTLAGALLLLSTFSVAVVSADEQEPRAHLRSLASKESAPSGDSVSSGENDQRKLDSRAASVRENDAASNTKTVRDRERQKRKAARDVALMMLGISQSSTHRD